MNLEQKNQKLGQDCYYETDTTRTQYPTLESALHADVVVIGGGLAGLSTALDLVEKGQQVVVLESQKLSGHASGRNGGQAIAGYACGQTWLEGHLGLRDAQKLWQLSLLSLELMRERMTRYAIDCHPVWSYMTVADRPRKALALKEEALHMHRYYGHEMTYVEGSALRQHIGSNEYVAGLLDPASGHLQPLRYALGIARAAAAQGAQIYEYSSAQSLERQGNNWLVCTPKGQVSARHVVLAGNCGLLWQSPNLATQLHRRIMPVGTYMIATEPLSSELAHSTLPTCAAVCDNNFVLDYYRLSPDQRMLFGGRVSYTTASPSHLTQAMQQRMVQIFPQLADAKIEHTWGGFVDISRQRAPDWGRLENGIFYAQGFSGHGLAATTLAGRVICQAIMGDAESLGLFERIRQSSFPGGSALRLPLLLAGTSFYRLRDWLS